MASSPPLLAAVIAAVLGAGGLGAFLQTKNINRRTSAEALKLSAEADVTLGGGWQTLYSAQRQDTNELRERVAVLEHDEAKCQKELEKLKGQMTVSSLDMEQKVIELLDKEIVKRGIHG